MSPVLTLDHWLDDRLIRVRLLAAERVCTLTICHSFRTKSGTYPATSSVGIVDSFLGELRRFGVQKQNKRETA
jgi:hypothetical protein